MKGITNSDAVAKAVKEIIAALKQLGYKNGAELQEDEIAAEKGVIFWYQNAEGEATKKPTYIILDSFLCSASARADNEIRNREVGISIDVWTIYPLTNTNTRSIERAIETKLDAWEIERSQSCDTSDKRYGIHFDLYKNF